MSLCIKFADRESECCSSPLSSELLLPLSQLPGHAFLSSSLAMLLLQPWPRLHAFVRPKDRMASCGWLNFPLFSIPCCPDGVKLWRFFSGLESHRHLASGSFITPLSGGPPHGVVWNSKLKTQAHEKKAINIYIVCLWWCYKIQRQAWGYCNQDQILSPYCEDADFRDVQGTSHKSFMLSSHCLLGPGKLNPGIWPVFKGNLRKTHLHNPTEAKTLTWIRWSSNQCPQEMLIALRRTSWATLC